jgi:Family of unknown function (DUF5641)
MFSDNGGNFIAAADELNVLQQLAIQEKVQTSLKDPALADQLANQGIQWSFNPPAAPHHGGLWEAAIKNTKFFLRRVMGTSVLDFEEFTTLLNQIESILNSRPLTQLTADPEDLEALTPGHFLIGRPLTSAPEPSLEHIKMNKLSRWQLIQKMTQSFWKRWSTQYLTQLQHRRKWKSVQENLKVGQLVLLAEDQVPPLFWPLARICEIHPGSDEMVRVVTLKTRGVYSIKRGKSVLSFSTLKRPITKIIPLPDDDKSEDNPDSLRMAESGPPTFIDVLTFVSHLKKLLPCSQTQKMSSRQISNLHHLRTLSHVGFYSYFETCSSH